MLLGLVFSAGFDWLDPDPTLRSLAVASCWASQTDDFWHFKAHFVFDDFAKGDVGHAEILNVGDHRSAGAAVSGIELAHAA